MRNEDHSSLVTFHPSSFRFHPFAKWVRPQLPDFRRDFSRGERKLAAHGRRQIDHLHAAAVQSDLIQQLLRVFNSPTGIEITFQVMTFAFQSACHQHAVGAVLKRAQHVGHVQFAGAGQFHNLDGGWIFQPHRTGQIGRRIRAVMAAERDYVRFKTVLAQAKLLISHRDTEALRVLENKSLDAFFE